MLERIFGQYKGNYNMDKIIIHTSYGNFTVGIVAMRVEY